MQQLNLFEVEIPSEGPPRPGFYKAVCLRNSVDQLEQGALYWIKPVDFVHSSGLVEQLCYVIEETKSGLRLISKYLTLEDFDQERLGSGLGRWDIHCFKRIEEAGNDGTT